MLWYFFMWKLRDIRTIGTLGIAKILFGVDANNFVILVDEYTIVIVKEPISDSTPMLVEIHWHRYYSFVKGKDDTGSWEDILY